MNRQFRNRFIGRVVHKTLTTLAIILALCGNVALGVDVKIPQIRTAAEKGNVSQEIELAADYYVGRGVPQDLKLAAYWYEKAAESGDSEAQNEVGYLYQTGTGVAADSSRAFHWYQLAAASGNVIAKVNLGVAYLWGYGVPADQSFALQLFREAASKGSGVAATYLGDLYYFGKGVSPDKAAAERWFEAGERLHDPKAAYNLGSLYFDIHDHAQDFPKAAKLLREAAVAGYVPGMYSLGVLLTKHPELAISPQEARSYLQTAADSGSWKASIVLGVLERDGMGVPVNHANAFYRFQIAILQGGDAAKRLLVNDLAKLNGELPDDETRNLTANANAWFSDRKSNLDFVYKDGTKSKRFPSMGIMANDEGVHGGQLLPPPA